MRFHSTRAVLKRRNRETTPFVQRRTVPDRQWDDECLHRVSFRRDPELYALSAK
jgi:hypothetical protein